MTAALCQGFWGRLGIVPTAFLLGAVAPDVPLWLLGLGNTLAICNGSMEDRIWSMKNSSYLFCGVWKTRPSISKPEDTT